MLLDSDDPLDIAIAIETALEAPPVTIAASGPAQEPCRLETSCGGREPLAGNGRCMTCGANRAAPAPVAPPEAQKPKTAPTPRPRKKKAKASRNGIIYDPALSFIGRYKELTGATDAEVAEMLGKARQTISAYSHGRLAENLDRGGARIIMNDLADRMVLMAELKRDLGVEMGDFTPD